VQIPKQLTIEVVHNDSVKFPGRPFILLKGCSGSGLSVFRNSLDGTDSLQPPYSAPTASKKVASRRIPLLEI
jgi:hypothetical protein